MVQPASVPYERVVGRYALYGEIASGGMATVHFGRLLGPVGFSRTVAIKRLHAQFAKDPEFVAMFLDEARLAGRIQHPNVVGTLDVVALEGELFLVMEYVQGESLARLLGALNKRGLTVPPPVAAAIITGMLYGLHAAHEATDERGEALSIVHRDVSPQNVIVGSDGVARVLDFGVAKAAGRMQATREGEIKGKLAYMAPEQMRGEAMDRRTDIYGAAVVLWETLTTRRLFDGEHAGVIFSKVMSGSVERPSALAAGVPPALDEIVLRGLEHDLSKRYATARQMAMAIEDHVHVASSRQVAEWLASVAGDSLHKRAVRVQQIESMSTPPPIQLASLTGANPGPSPSVGASVNTGVGANTAPWAPSPPSAFATSTPAFAPASGPPPLSGQPTSQISTVMATSAPSPRPASKGVLLAAVGAAILFGGSIAFLMFGRDLPSTDPAAPSSSGASASGASAPSAASAPALSSSSPAIAPSPSAGASSSASSGEPALAPPAASTAAPAASTAATSTPKPAVPSSRPAGQASPPAKAGCVPPYTIDAAGIRHPKPECL